MVLSDCGRLTGKPETGTGPIGNFRLADNTSDSRECYLGLLIP